MDITKFIKLIGALEVGVISCGLIGNGLSFVVFSRKVFRKQLAVIFSCAIGNALIYLSVPIQLELSEISIDNVTKTVCDGKNHPFYQMVGSIYLFEANLIPFCLMMASTTVTLKCLIKSRKNLEKITNRGIKRRKEKDAKFALNSVILNISFVIFQVPVVLTYIVPVNDPNTSQVVFLYCFVLFCLNYSITFGIFMLSNSIFRNEFMRLIGLGKGNKVSH
jgi:NADH:ubiquinone oxidoreductase subunit 3 (subunit A)